MKFGLKFISSRFLFNLFPLLQLCQLVRECNDLPYAQRRDQRCGKAPASPLKLLLCTRRKIGRNPMVWTCCFISQEGEGRPGPARLGSMGSGLPGPSGARRLKTKLPAGCSAAWRYHRGKWSMVNTLDLSSGVRNSLPGERFGSSLHIWGHVYPLFFHTQLACWAKRATPLCVSGLAGRISELLIGGALDDAPSRACLFQNQMLLLSIFCFNCFACRVCFFWI